jgi:hypothetical protein
VRQKSSIDVNAKSERNFEIRMSDVAERQNSLLGLVWPVLGVGVVLVALAPFIVSVEHAREGVAIGALVAAANLAAIGFVVRGVMRGALVSWGALAALKFALLLFAVWIVLKNHWAGPLPLVLGYAALPLGIVVGQLTRAQARSEG